MARGLINKKKRKEVGSLFNFVFTRIPLIVFGVLIFLFLFCSLILGNVIQLLSLIVYPFSKKMFRYINSLLAGAWWGGCSYFVKLAGIDIRLQGDPVVKDENAIILTNHQSWNDVPVIFRLAVKANQIGNMKWFVKDELKYVPGIGVGLIFVNSIFLKRSWSKDKKHIIDKLSFFKKEKIPVWLMLFPEGTRFTCEKKKRSNLRASRSGLNPLSYLLFPKVKGFIIAVQGLKDYCKSVYDFTIVYPENVKLNFVNLFLGKIRYITIHVRRFNISSIPLGTDEAVKEWLIDRFYEKDKIIENILLND